MQRTSISPKTGWIYLYITSAPPCKSSASYSFIRDASSGWICFLNWILFSSGERPSGKPESLSISLSMYIRTTSPSSISIFHRPILLVSKYCLNSSAVKKSIKLSIHFGKRHKKHFKWYHIKFNLDKKINSAIFFQANTSCLFRAKNIKSFLRSLWFLIILLRFINQNSYGGGRFCVHCSYEKALFKAHAGNKRF